MLTSTRGVVCQRRCYWFDRFVRTGTHNDSLAAVNENGRPVNKYGTGGRDRDTYFGYIPNHYELEERAMFDRKTIEPEKIRDPCDEIPDVMTFLERSDPDAFQLEEHESKFSDWNDLMTCSYMELVYRKSIPAAEAKMIWIARERYNSGETLHRRPQHDWKQWGKKRQENPPFPENYYPHMRYGFFFFFFCTDEFGEETIQIKEPFY